MNKTIILVLYLLNTLTSFSQTYNIDLGDKSYFFVDENTIIPHFIIKPKDGKYKITRERFDTSYLYISAIVENGKFNGPCQIFHENGLIESSGYLTNGSRIGMWTYFNQSGQLIREEFIKENFRGSGANLRVGKRGR